jgi:hypothetical protein
MHTSLNNIRTPDKYSEVTSRNVKTLDDVLQW